MIHYRCLKRIKRIQWCLKNGIERTKKVAFMTKKKQTHPSISQGEGELVQSMLARYHQLATQLRASTDEQTALAALAEMNALPAGAQIELTKELARVHHTDAADVLAALHEFGTQKEARKEARRSLIRLEGAKIYPGWKAPSVPQVVDTMLQETNFPSRFLKGLITDSRDTGEMQLILCWETGEDYREVRLLGFLLEFWFDGIKDFFTSVESQRSFANLLARMTDRPSGVKLKECSLEEGIALLEEAKAVNARHGTRPHRDYTRHRALIDQLLPASLVAQVTSEMAAKEQDEEEIDLSGLAPHEVVVGFIESWADGDLGIAYQILAAESPLREGLARDAWLERRTNWDEHFNPTDVQPALLHTRATPKQRVWRPTTVIKRDGAATQEVEVGWSVELDELLLDEHDRPPEWPTPTLVYAETKRHWFWASFTLVQENDAWHIQSMTDEFLKAQELSEEDLKKRIREIDQKLSQIIASQQSAEFKSMDEAEITQLIRDTIFPAQQSVYYAEVLLKKDPSNRILCEDVVERTLETGQRERSLVYLQALLELSPEERAPLHRQIAELQWRLAQSYSEEEDEERIELYLTQAEKSLFASLALEDSPTAHITLAEVLLERDDRLEEARSHLLQAQQALSEPDEQAHIEMHLGEIDLRQELPARGLSHLQKAVELQPENDTYWEMFGDAQRESNQLAEAESSYKRSIDLAPDNSDHYSALALLYKSMNQNQAMLQTLKDGLTANPESVELHLYLATAYEETGDSQQADNYLEKAEQLDPDSEMVASFRQVLDLSRLNRAQESRRPTKLSGQKKKKHH